jgi:hypothetical protein
MQNTAIAMAEKSDEIERIKQKDVDPLLKNVKTQVAPLLHFNYLQSQSQSRSIT